MKLIDADELLIYIKEEIKQDRPDDFKILNIKRVVEDTPTAYDVNKVVKKLEELRADYRNDYDYDVSFGIGMAIGIVKEGIKMSKYEVGQKIKIDDFDTLDEIMDAGYKAEWVSIGVIEITAVPKEGDKNDRH